MNATISSLLTTTLCPKHMAKLAQNKTGSSNDPHAGHDMSAHSSHNLHDGMIMNFHGGYNEIILFEFWETKSIGIFLLSCFILFVFAALYEGLKLAREKLIKYEIASQQMNLNSRTPIRNCDCKNCISKTCDQNGNASNLHSSALVKNDEEVAILDPSAVQHGCCSKNNPESSAKKESLVLKSFSSRLLSKGHLLQTLLHMLQITVSYLLMLVFMTYNSWLCLSIVLGAGLGYFVFGLQRITSIDVNEHCH